MIFCFQIGDYVLVAVRCRTSKLECYMPGKVMGIPVNFNLEYKFYTVRLFSGRTVRCIQHIIAFFLHVFFRLGFTSHQHYKSYIATISFTGE